LRWWSSISWLNQVWLLIKHEGEKLKHPHIYIFCYLLELCINNNKVLAIYFFSKSHWTGDQKLPKFWTKCFFFGKWLVCTPPKVGHLKKSSTHAVVLLKSWGLNNSTKFNSFCGIMEHKLDEKYIIITFNKF